MKLRTIAFFCSVSLAQASIADDYVEYVGAGASGGVNWSAGRVQAEGAGIAPPDKPLSVAKLLACRAAVVDAQRNLLESIQGVRVRGATVVANMMVQSDVIKTTVEGLLQGGQVVDKQPQNDGTCIVTMTAPMNGKFTRDVYGEVFDRKTSALPRLDVQEQVALLIDAGLSFIIPSAQANQALPWQDTADRLDHRISELEDLVTTHPAVVQEAEGGPTGLVIDARGSNFRPSMSPMIRKIKEDVIYPNNNHLDTRRQRGQLVSLFTRDLDTARRHPVVGDRPLVLKALRTFGDSRTEIVLGSESAQRLVTMVKDGFLDDAGVIIVL